MAQIFAVLPPLFKRSTTLRTAQNCITTAITCFKAKLFITTSKVFFKSIQYTVFKHLRDHRAYCYTAEVLTRKLFRTIVFDFRDWNNITITKPRGNIFAQYNKCEILFHDYSRLPAFNPSLAIILLQFCPIFIVYHSSLVLVMESLWLTSGQPRSDCKILYKCASDAISGVISASPSTSCRFFIGDVVAPIGIIRFHAHVCNSLA